MDHLPRRLALIALAVAFTLAGGTLGFARIDEEASELKMRRAGADFVFAPYDSTGHGMAQAFLKPHVHQFINFTTQAGGPDVDHEMRVGTRCSFAEHTLAEMPARRELGVIVLAAGDHLIVMGESERLQKLGQLLAGTAA